MATTVDRKRIWIAVIVIMAAGLAAWAYVQTPGVAMPSVFGPNRWEENSKAFESAYDGRLAHYSDADYGFSFAYPIGYAVSEEARAFADSKAVLVKGGSGSAVELFEVMTLPDSVSREDFGSVARSYPEKEVQAKFEATIGGKQAFVLNQKTGDLEGLGTVYSRQAFINGCKSPDGNAYSMAITAVIPYDTVGDLPLADYFINSARC